MKAKNRAAARVRALASSAGTPAPAVAPVVEAPTAAFVAAPAPVAVPAAAVAPVAAAIPSAAPAVAPELLKLLPVPSVDFEALVTTQRHNLHAALETQRLATEGLQAIAMRQSDLFEETVGELHELARGLETPESCVELATSMAFRSLDEVRELSKLAASANQEILSVVLKRSTASVAEIQAAVRFGRA